MRILRIILGAMMSNRGKRLVVFVSLACLPLVSYPASGQTVPPPPTLRDAFSVRGGRLERTVRLQDDLKLIFCKTEYDAWTQALHPPPDLSLYLDGILMKGANPRVDTVDSPTDEKTSATSAQCAANGQEAKDADKAATDAETEAKTAAAKAADEKDPAKMDAGKKDAEDKAAKAKDARDKAKLVARRAGALYTLTVYLSPGLVSADMNDKSWLQFLERSSGRGPISISAGPSTGPWPSEATIVFERIRIWWLLGWMVLFAFAIVLFVKYARSSDIIRDTGILPPVNGVAQQKSYSLARTQMAMWTFLVAGSLVFIFMITWNVNPITNGVLILIGISSGTTLLAATADGPNPDPQPTQGFLKDLLSDGDGPAFHRYQMMLFTIVLAFIFVVKVAGTLAMPEFEASLLALMGISNGTYLGFKLQDR